MVNVAAGAEWRDEKFTIGAGGRPVPGGRSLRCAGLHTVTLSCGGATTDCWSAVGAVRVEHASDQSDAPGADDNASGIAVVSEVLRVVLASDFRPRRTLQFMAYAAEEVGLRGSRAIAREYDLAGKNVVGAMQLDMTGFSGSSRDLYFVTDYVSTDLTNFLKRLIGEYNGPGSREITFGETACGYACSDHAAWTEVGVPAVHPFETRAGEHNAALHTAEDRLGRIDTTGQKQALFAKLGIEFMMEVSKADQAH